MPGAYAHITLVNILRETEHIDSIPGFVDEAKRALLRFFKFCELGAVSPDYPYLALTARRASLWADLMHYKHTGKLIGAAVARVAQMSPGVERNKALSWLLGYSAHVAADTTIHPVVELKVGPYETNQRSHRVCEMHQDAYIFQRLNLGAVGLAEHLDAGIWACCDAPDSGRLDPVIARLWKAVLKECHGQEYALGGAEPEAWHRGFRRILDKVEEGGRLFPAARHLAVDCGLTYPNPEEVDPQYVTNLRVPTLQRTLHYDDVFDLAVTNVKKVWSDIAQGVFAGMPVTLDDWNLDTGRNGQNQYAFWS